MAAVFVLALLVAFASVVLTLRILWHAGSLARDLRGLVRNLTAAPPALRR